MMRDIQAKLKEYYSYDKNNGEFVRRKDAGRWKAGTIAGTKDKDGYLIVRFDGRSWKAHHLAWLYVYGELPKLLDHINRTPSDNRIENLRLADKRINSFNAKVQSNNTSGKKGVSWNRRLNRWHAYIGSKKSRKHLGFYDDLEEAVDARKDAEGNLDCKVCNAVA